MQDADDDKGDNYEGSERRSSEQGCFRSASEHDASDSRGGLKHEISEQSSMNDSERTPRGDSEHRSMTDTASGHGSSKRADRDANGNDAAIENDGSKVTNKPGGRDADKEGGEVRESTGQRGRPKGWNRFGRGYKNKEAKKDAMRDAEEGGEEGGHRRNRARDDDDLVGEGPDSRPIYAAR
jgi:hypothetical protein